MRMVDQKTINSFVNAVEQRKGFKKEYPYVFRHLVTEVAELENAVYAFELYGAPEETGAYAREHFRRKVGYELWDIIFLACYIAEIFRIDLNGIVKENMDNIRRKYDVEWPKKKRRRACQALKASTA